MPTPDTPQTAERALTRLQEASTERTPACDGIDLFTADYITPTDRTHLARICTHCDLQILCRQYADTANPRIGFWAGTYHGPKTRPNRDAEAVDRSRGKRTHVGAVA